MGGDGGGGGNGGRYGTHVHGFHNMNRLILNYENKLPTTIICFYILSIYKNILLNHELNS